MYVYVYGWVSLLNWCNIIRNRSPQCAPKDKDFQTSSDSVLLDHLQALREKGYSGLVVQTGTGSYLPPPVPKGFHLECYSYKSSLHDDLHKSSLVICHGGKWNGYTVCLSCLNSCTASFHGVHQSARS